MKIYEKELLKLNNLKPLSSEARSAYDKSYDQILSGKQSNAKKSKRVLNFKPYVILLGAALIGLIFTISPISKAVSNFLNLFDSTSTTLKNTNFVTQQGGSTSDQGIRIELKEFYIDQQETGFSFVVNLPSNSKLLNPDLNEFTLNFALIDNDGKTLMDLNSGKSFTEPKKEMANYTGKSYIDRSENQIEFKYKYRSNGDKKTDIQNAHILVTKITGTDSTTKEPGQHLQSQRKQGTYEIVQGSWEIPIRSEQIKNYPSIEYTPVDKNFSNDISASATPTSVIVDVKVSSGIGKGGNPNNIWISQTGDRKQYKWREASTKKVDGDNIYRIIFDYPNYDSSDSITVHFSDHDIELKTVN